jgi:hypothetical protein
MRGTPITAQGSAKQLRKPSTVEADHDITIDNCYRSGVGTQRLQPVERRLLARDVVLLEVNAFLTKELLRATAKDSARLAVQDDHLRHRRLSGSLAPPEIR